jgi:hypothetical protein
MAFGHRERIAKATMPSRTPSNGLEMANQNETLQSESSTVELVFTLLSQAFKDRHFKKCENFCTWLLVPLPINLDAGDQGESY